MVSEECASAGSKEKKAVWLCPHGSCLKFAHRYEVISRQHSGSCGEDAIIRIEDKKLLPRVILTKKKMYATFC